MFLYYIIAKAFFNLLFVYLQSECLKKTEKSYDQNIAHVIQVCISVDVIIRIYMHTKNKHFLFASFQSNLNNKVRGSY